MTTQAFPDAHDPLSKIVGECLPCKNLLAVGGWLQVSIAVVRNGPANSMRNQFGEVEIEEFTSHVSAVEFFKQRSITMLGKVIPNSARTLQSILGRFAEADAGPCGRGHGNGCSSFGTGADVAIGNRWAWGRGHGDKR